jgi:polyhydroxybutyrate depolymerase
MKSLVILSILVGASLACADRSRETIGTISVGGRDRTYRVHVPPRVTGKVPLVVALHGGSWDGAKMESVSELDATADRHGFIVVYPDSIPSARPVERQWADGRGTTKASLEGVDDVAFISALIDKLSKEHAIDPARIYATGISNGGFMSFRLACELSDRIAAIAPVAATMPVDAAPACKPTRPLAVFAIHGTEDPLVPFAGGEVQGGSGGKILSVADTMKLWATIDGCDPKPVTSEVPDRAPRDGMRTHRDVYTHCKTGTDLVLYTVEGGGHTWPGGGFMDPKFVGKTTRDFDASEAIWTFLSAHALPVQGTARR